MQRSQTRGRWAPAGLVVAFLAGAAGAQVNDFVVGRDAAGRLKVQLNFQVPFPLPDSQIAGITGWAAMLPGFISLGQDVPTENFFKLSPACNIVFDYLGGDPGCFVFDELGLRPLSPGETFGLGPPGFQANPIWAIPGGAKYAVYEMRLRLRDLSGVYLDSDDITPTFLADAACPANCNGDRSAGGMPQLDISDFVCFQNMFALSDPAANCNGDRQPGGEPLLDIQDFVCFQNAFALGCR